MGVIVFGGYGMVVGFFFFGGGGEVVKRGFCYFLVDVLYILYFYRRMICK